MREPGLACEFSLLSRKCTLPQIITRTSLFPEGCTLVKWFEAQLQFEPQIHEDQVHEDIVRIRAHGPQAHGGTATFCRSRL